MNIDLTQPTVRNEQLAFREPTAAIFPASSAAQNGFSGLVCIESAYAHAIAAETQGAACYREVGAHLADQGNDSLAGLFHRLGEFCRTQSLAYARQASALALPKVSPWEYDWLFEECPTPGAVEMIFRMMTRNLALRIAIIAERRALRCFERVMLESDDAQTRQLAYEIVCDRHCRLQWLGDALAQ